MQKKPAHLYMTSNHYTIRQAILENMHHVTNNVVHRLKQVAQ